MRPYDASNVHRKLRDDRTRRLLLPGTGTGPRGKRDHGDLFQRLTTNKRTGRAVSFQNSINIIGSTIAAKCPRSYPKYSELFSEEFKHDCLFAQSDIDLQRNI